MSLTYTTYQKCKLENPKQAVRVNERGDTFTPDNIRLNVAKWKIAEPSDHCTTLRNFQACGGVLETGDYIMDIHGNVQIIPKCDSFVVSLDTWVLDNTFVLQSGGTSPTTNRSSFSTEDKKYEPLTGSVFEIKHKFQNGETFYKENGVYKTCNDENTLMASLLSNNLYQKFDEKKYFVDTLGKILDCTEYSLELERAFDEGYRLVKAK
ncbi:hypothetical protein WCWAEYFT_CDS0064 [Vibrio phage VB_VaC_TDDLMA]